MYVQLFWHNHLFVCCSREINNFSIDFKEILTTYATPTLVQNISKSHQTYSNIFWSSESSVWAASAFLWSECWYFSLLEISIPIDNSVKIIVCSKWGDGRVCVYEVMEGGNRKLYIVCSYHLKYHWI